MNNITINWLRSGIEQNIISKVMVEQLIEFVEQTGGDLDQLDNQEFITQIINELVISLK